MSFGYVKVKRYQRGATWSDGSPRMCTRCGVERTRRKVAIVTAFLTNDSTRYQLPVGYCPDHLPDELVSG